MKVAETISIVREWVEQNGPQLPGFQAAHLIGSVTTMPQDASFPDYGDVDIALVCNVETEQEHVSPGGLIAERENLEVLYRDVIIECGFCSAGEYRSAETLLSNPELAPHLAVDSVLYDPHGLLGAVQPIVAREYRRRRWVQARCAAKQQETWQHLEELERAETPDDYIGAILWLVGTGLCGLLEVANLRATTHRRCLIIAHDLLSQAGRPDLHEALLALLGHADLARPEVEGWLTAMGEAFDRAVTVKRSPTSYTFKLHAHIRPYIVESARELIEEGFHREAMWWIALVYFACNITIQNDGSADEKATYAARTREIFMPLSVEAASERQARYIRARRLTDELFVLADEMVAHHPSVVE